jgi:dTDP-4-dehydrorhamnose reductase
VKIWVVAKDGLVGKEMCKFLKEKGVSYFGTGRKEGDICNPTLLEEVYQKEKPTHIINCSANVHVDKAEMEEAGLAYDINVLGVMNLAELAKKHKIHLVHISTDYVFDGEMERDYLENDPVSPINVYGRTKQEGEEKMLKIYPKACSIRTASLYGSAKPGLVFFILKGLQEESKMQHISDQISNPTYVKDLVRAIYDLKEESGIFHFVNKGAVSRVGLVEEIKRQAEKRGMKLKCKEIVGVTRCESKRPAIRPKRSALSTSKVEKHLTFPIRTWQEAVSAYLDEIA